MDRRVKPGNDGVARAIELLRTTPAGHRQRHALLFAELLVRVVVRMRLGGSRRGQAGIGDRLIVRQSLPARLGAARRGRRRVDVVAAEREYRAVKRLGRMLADIAAAHVARETREVALERRAEAAAAGAQDIGIARVQDLIERLAVVKALFLLGGETVDRDRIAGTAEPALEAPRLALHPIHLRVKTKVVAGLHHLLAAKPAAEAAGAARVRPQRVALDQQRIFRLDLLGGAVVGVAVVHGDGRVAAVAVVLGTPAAADQPTEIDVETVVLRAAAIDAA